MLNLLLLTSFHFLEEIKIFLLLLFQILNLKLILLVFQFFLLPMCFHLTSFIYLSLSLFIHLDKFFLFMKLHQSVLLTLVSKVNFQPHQLQITNIYICALFFRVHQAQVFQIAFSIQLLIKKPLKYLLLSHQQF